MWTDRECGPDAVYDPGDPIIFYFEAAQSGTISLYYHRPDGTQVIQSGFIEANLTYYIPSQIDPDSPGEGRILRILMADALAQDYCGFTIRGGGNVLCAYTNSAYEEPCSYQYGYMKLIECDSTREFYMEAEWPGGIIQKNGHLSGPWLYAFWDPQYYWSSSCGKYILTGYSRGEILGIIGIDVLCEDCPSGVGEIYVWTNKGENGCDGVYRVGEELIIYVRAAQSGNVGLLNYWPDGQVQQSDLGDLQANTTYYLRGTVGGPEGRKVLRVVMPDAYAQDYCSFIVEEITPTPPPTPTATHTATPTATPGCPPDHYEPNNTFDYTFELPAENVIGSPVEAFICPAGDEDLFVANVPAHDTDVNIQLYDLPADFDLQLYDPHRNLVASSAASGTKPEGIQYNVRMVIGDYTIKVYGYARASSIAPYTLSVNLRALEPQTPPSDLIQQHITTLEPVLAKHGLSAEDFNFDLAVGYPPESELMQAAAPVSEYPANNLESLDGRIFAIFFQPAVESEHVIYLPLVVSRHGSGSAGYVLASSPMSQEADQDFALRAVFAQPIGMWRGQYLTAENGATVIVGEVPASKVREDLPSVDPPLVRFRVGNSHSVCFRGDGFEICFPVPWRPHPP